MELVAVALCCGDEFLFDLGAAVRGFNDDTVGAEFLFVVGEGGDSDCAGAEKAVAAGHVACGNSAKREMQGLSAERCNDPANGADEAGAVEASPSHGARPG